MSQGEPIPIDVARPIAEHLVELLAPSCVRIAIAGSIRREKPMVSDIELVAIPRVVQQDGDDLWGTLVEINQLELLLELARNAGELRLRDVENHRADGSVDVSRRDGDAYKALVYQDLPVDLFIVRDPLQWGVIFALRTGPGDWNTRLVTDCKAFLRRVEGGYLYRSGQRVATSEEADFFVGIGQPWVEPRDRSVSRVSIRARVSHPVSHATPNAAESGIPERVSGGGN